MTASTSSPLPPPAPRPLHEEGVAVDLDTRILRAEQRLIAREENLRRRFGSVGLRVRTAWQPRQLIRAALKPLLVTAAVGLGVAAVGWWRRRHRAPAGHGAQREAAAAGGGHGHGHGSGTHWLLHGVQWIGLVWPLLPRSWRASVPNWAVTLTTGAGLPLLEALLQQLPQRRPPSKSSPPSQGQSQAPSPHRPSQRNSS